MKTIVISTVVFIFITAAVLLYRDYYVTRKFRKLAEKKYSIVAPMMQKLAMKETLTQGEILLMAKDPSLRLGLFKALETYSVKNLFPLAYLTHASGAESFLVNWLEFPTELGNAPDEIEFFEKITLLESEALDYFVFKYRTQSPAWATAYDWMLGVAGPYRKESMPYDVPLRVFSRFNSVGSISPEDEVRWVHENINKKL